MEEQKENKNLVAAHGFIVNSRQEILLLKEKGSDLWLGLSALVPSKKEPLETIKKKSEKELNLKVNNFQIFDSGLVGDLLVLRFVATDIQGEVKLAEKYEEFAWHSFSSAKELKNICPFVKKTLGKIEAELEKDDSEKKYLRALADYQNLLKQHEQQCEAGVGIEVAQTGVFVGKGAVHFGGARQALHVAAGGIERERTAS